MSEKVALTIDGVEVEAEPGSMIIQAAMDNGLYIPYLCYYPGMKPYGACRMCVVKAESPTPDGSYRPLPGSPASCTTPISEGMKVETNTDDLINLRKGVMELLISEHPHGCLNCHRIDLCGPSDVCLRHVSVNDRCVTCPKNERCELKDTVRYMDMELTTPLTYNNRHLPLDVKDPYWDMDMNLCIVCARCVRACDEVRGDKAITLKQNSGRSIIGTAQGTSLLESGCEFCGLCIDVCPTGAIVERDYKWDKAEKQVTTTCPHCPVGCQLSLEINKRNKLIRSIPEREAAANQGMACFKGKFGLDFVNSKERLKSPQIRKNGSLQDVSWPEALNYTAERLSDFQNGEYSILMSPRGTNEDGYVAGKFARIVMNSNNIDISSNITSDTDKILNKMIGGRPQNHNWALLNSKCILVVGSNLTEEQNVLGVPIKQALSKGTKLIVIDQRETELTRYADIWIRPRVGTDATIIGAIMRTIIDESLEDHDFITERCENFNDLRDSLWDFDLSKSERTTGIDQNMIRKAARMIANYSPVSFLYGLETLELSLQDNFVSSIINLGLLTGNIDKPSSGIYHLLAGANERGARDMGCMPTTQHGNESSNDLPGIGFINICAALKSKEIKVLHLLGDSPHYHNGYHDDFLEILKDVEFTILQDTVNSELTKMADVVLPSAAFSEKDGTYTNMEGRVQAVQRAMGPKDEQDEDWHILSQLAQRMGNMEFDYPNSSSVFDEIKDKVDAYGEIDIEKVFVGEAFVSPPVNETFSFAPITLISETSMNRKEGEYPLLFAPGRVLHQPDRDAEIEIRENMNKITRNEIVEINKQDAISIGAAEGDLVNVTGKNFEFTGVAHVNGIHEGMVASTALFGSLIESMSNSEYADPVITLKSLMLSPVQVKKLTGSKKE